jgi:hypothetical protein
MSKLQRHQAGSDKACNCAWEADRASDEPWAECQKAGCATDDDLQYSAKQQPRTNPGPQLIWRRQEHSRQSLNNALLRRGWRLLHGRGSRLVLTQVQDRDRGLTLQAWQRELALVVECHSAMRRNLGDLGEMGHHIRCLIEFRSPLRRR